MTDGIGRGLIEGALVAGVAIWLLTVSGCAPTKATPPTVVVTGCEAFQIIRPSSKDTEDTKRQVLAHDVAYQKLCAPVEAKK